MDHDGRPPGRPRQEITAEVMAAYVAFAKGYYRKAGKVTREYGLIVEAYRSYIGEVSNSVKLQQLWPIVGDTLNWPPSLPFQDDEVDSLAFDWVEKQWGARGLPGRPQERDVLRLANWLEAAIKDGLGESSDARDSSF